MTPLANLRNPKAAEYASRELHLDKGRLTNDARRQAA